MNNLISVIAIWWYKLRLLICQLFGLRMTLTLPRDPKSHNILDKNKITKVMLFYPLPPHSPYFMCEIDGVWRHLVFSDDLKNWFDASGIKISVIQDYIEQVTLDFYKLNPTIPNVVEVPTEFAVKSVALTNVNAI